MFPSVQALKRYNDSKKQLPAIKHLELETMLNLEIIKAERIEYLYGFLHLLTEIVLSTFKRKVRSKISKPKPRNYASRPTKEDGAGYRRRLGGSDKKANVNADINDLEFYGGFGYGNTS
ncbi:hypothetical protein HZH68_015021 [Vespula germanica]|uniref:Uncharacterized protein n=1 Tax=Vespula germanica TaxID=30212 RepID=A0A834J9Q2_VESGE|nr:hypothetical protein HZH68_015021 [Vespula germanica]